MTREQVLEIMPEINLIHNTELREKSIRCWQDVIEMGGWDKKGIENAPLGVGYVSDDCPERGIDHCRRVVRCCKVMWDELHEYANEVSSLDYDLLMTGAVLHDIGKFACYDRKDGKGCHTALGEKFNHVTVGAYVARKNELPEDVVYIILQHSDNESPGGANAHDTPELLTLKRVDLLCFKLAADQYPAKK